MIAARIAGPFGKMVKAVAEFLIGAAVIVNPQFQVPLLAGSAAFKVGQALARRARRGNDSEQEVPQNGAEKRVALEWNQLSVAITNKKTKKRQEIFKDLKGTARPGRSVL